MALPQVFREFDLPEPDESELEAMTLFWHKLPAWPDVADSLERLRNKYIVSTLTILSVPLVVSCSRQNGIVWDAIISCQMMDHYKFHTPAYKNGCRMLGLEPEKVMMVAAHNLDLEAAAKAGMRTALVSRPDEWGKEGNASAPDHSEASFEFNYSTSGLADLADQLLERE
jgi:2-haloacid dehalogenase